MGEFSLRKDRPSGIQMPELPELKDDVPEDEKVSLLPVPTGYKLLIVLPDPEETTKGGIVKATETLQKEEISSIVGWVADVGPDAYADKSRFNKPWCQKGDWVMFKAYSGTRFTVYGKEMRLLNDDSIDAVVADPRGILKV